uniref:Uncharacterized protein n=1 Tax=Arundo donax TaxID=35708 RepID=A0A0A8Y5Y2_ARUDO
MARRAMRMAASLWQRAPGLEFGHHACESKMRTMN